MKPHEFYFWLIGYLKGADEVHPEDKIIEIQKMADRVYWG